MDESLTAWSLTAGVVVCLAALLAAERDRSRPWAQKAVWVAKPGASAGFVMLGALAMDPQISWHLWIVAALGASWLGDVLLVPVGAPKAFKRGIAAFALAHLAFCAGFWALGVDWGAAGSAAVVVAGIAWAVARWVLPHVPADLRAPVLAYIVVIGSMACLAVGAATYQRAPLVAVAGLMFFASDIAVARNRFVKRSFVNKLWGLPVYYGAQLAFAWVVLTLHPGA